MVFAWHIYDKTHERVTREGVIFRSFACGLWHMNIIITLIILWIFILSDDIIICCILYVIQFGICAIYVIACAYDKNEVSSWFALTISCFLLFNELYVWVSCLALSPFVFDIWLLTLLLSYCEYSFSDIMALYTWCFFVFNLVYLVYMRVNACTMIWMMFCRDFCLTYFW